MSQEMYKRIGEDTAYTFKGLYKESGWLELKYRFYLSVPIIFSIISLGFDGDISGIYLKALAVASLIFTFLALLDQKKFEKIDSYRVLAEKVKLIYDSAEESYTHNNPDHLQKLKCDWIVIKAELVNHPISIVSRLISKRSIKSEMNLKWLDGEYG
ncbi:hypothetical protein ACJJIW_12415 [Microbulbifer sp. JMSA004]|uniref:hypothetical protein n=1 Tax=Microbulbifer sp. JMSA004 TaxID=3243370 RepID=UPI00403A0DD8